MLLSNMVLAAERGAGCEGPAEEVAAVVWILWVQSLNEDVVREGIKEGFKSPEINRINRMWWVYKSR